MACSLALALVSEPQTLVREEDRRRTPPRTRHSTGTRCMARGRKKKTTPGDDGRSGGEIVVYEAPDGEVRVDVRFDRDTVWLTRRQMAKVFATSIDNVGLHLKNIYSDDELTEAATADDYSVVQTEGRRRVRRTLKHYNLDAIISVGYRVNSRRGVRFRQKNAFIRHLKQQGCRRLRQGRNHEWWVNETTNDRSAIPRHTEVNKHLARKICRDLGVVDRNMLEGGVRAKQRPLGSGRQLVRGRRIGSFRALLEVSLQ